MNTVTVNDYGTFNDNYGTVNTVTVNDYGMFNGNSGTVNTVTVNDYGTFNSDIYGSVNINTATVSGNGSFSGNATTATVSGNGSFSGTATTATVSGNGYFNGSASTATVSDNGYFYNRGGTVDTATVSDNGYFYNRYGGTVSTATVSGNGTFDHYRGIVNTVTVSGNGTFINNAHDPRWPTDDFGTVNSATLLGGTYSGDGYTGELYVGNGGVLDTGLYTGTIGNLSFAPDGGGLLLISGTSFDDFNKVNIGGKVDLTGASIQFSFDTAAAILPLGALTLGVEPLLLASAAAPASTLDSAFTFNLASLFNFIGENAEFAAENWWEGIDSISVTSGGELLQEYSGETLAAAFASGIFTVDANGNTTPEPATLLILGLGLVGLGLARRRMVK